jgi:Cu/Ag efflux protein CusF
MKIGRTSIALVVSTVLVSAAAIRVYAQTPDTTTKLVTEPGKLKATQTTKETFTILSIDSGSRDVLLMGSNGKLHTVNAGDQVRNFDQLRVGDKVTAEYTEAISLQLKKHQSGAPAASVEDAAVRAPVGMRPGAAVGRQVTALAHVVAVDTKKQVVTLRGPQGNQWDLTVQDPAQLKDVKSGDEVEVTYTEALAVSVQATPLSHTSQ